MSKYKYYAYFESSASYELMTAAEHEELESVSFYNGNMQAFKTLKEAKDYLLMHFRGEVSDAREQIFKIKSYRVKK